MGGRRPGRAAECLPESPLASLGIRSRRATSRDRRSAGAPQADGVLQGDPPRRWAPREAWGMFDRANREIGDGSRGTRSLAYLDWVARGAALASCARWIFSAAREAARRSGAGEPARFGSRPVGLPAPPTDVQVYGILVALDIERFGDPLRDDQIRVQLRRALYGAAAQALRGGGIPTERWQAWGTGDGLLLLADPLVETARVLRVLLDLLPDEIENRNRLRTGAARLRVRAVLHTAHVMLDEYGVIGEQVVRIFRLLDAEPLRSWLRSAPSPVAVAVSDDVYRQVVCQRARGLDPGGFQPFLADVKETRERAWVHADCGTGAAKAIQPPATTARWPGRNLVATGWRPEPQGVRALQAPS